ncbi:unannotated protein [freshwater metagenome]|uniref:Unannotated protein n=1 Tax=freshwater metagenome TaxID=449393 RepID=A0A6J7FGM1_9ZZZZ
MFYATALSRSGTCFVGRLSVEGKYLAVNKKYPIVVSSDGSDSNAATNELTGSAQNGRAYGAIKVDAPGAATDTGTETLGTAKSLCTAHTQAGINVAMVQRSYYAGWRTLSNWSQDPGTPAIAVASGDDHSCALMADTTVRCWGSNWHDQLGNNSTPDSLVPIRVFESGTTPLSGVTAISASGHHTCALLLDTTVRCWGSNANGELGDNSTTDSVVPVVVTGLSGVTAISLGSEYSCALLTDTVQCWGANGRGQLGNNSTAESHVPVDVITAPGVALQHVTAIGAGVYHACALTDAQTVYCWGFNVVGQLGNNSTAESHVPVQVVGPGGAGYLSGVAAIGAGGYHSCALSVLGAIRCWGSNGEGELGDGTNTDASVPVPPGGTPTGGATALSTGGFHSCVVIAGGVVQCWGYNSSGQLGSNTRTNSNVPVAVVGPGGSAFSGAIAISTGSYHTCALMAGGAVQCWGSNVYGELGDNSTANSSVPVTVLL